MAVFKCKMCGGALNIVNKMTVCECEYCGTRQTLPKLDDEKRINLYERANHFRRNNEFDKAMGIYEMILGEDNTDSEAYWSLVLCRYGIEYVDDPSTHKKVPTVNRAQTASVFNDADYMRAIENSDGYQKEVYEAEAKAIEKIQKGILEISSKEEPFDVFICYKETDAQGRRTHDSVYAQDIYNSLVKEGYRVFFSRITLESKIGTAYEPYIFAALNSAKVMLVVGTSSENMNSVWVKNEWSRYLSIIRADSSKSLIPCYKGMSPYDMPEEFAYLQSQDMGKIGFMQDLLHGIEKIITPLEKKEIIKEVVKEEISQSYGAASLERLLQNSATYLKLRNFSLAEEVYTTVTKEYPEDYRGWWGLIVCKTRNFSNIILDQTTTNVWLEYVKKLANSEDFAELENQYIEYTKEISQLAATEDIKKVNSIIETSNSSIQDKKQQIQALNSRIIQEENEWKQENDSYQNNIKSCENQISKAENMRFMKIIGITIGVVILLVGIIILFTGGWGILWGFLIGLIGVCVINYSYDSGGRNSKRKYFSQLNWDEEYARESIHNLKIRQNNNKDQFVEKIESLKQSISEAESDITALNEKIANCRKYLELGKDKISEFWFSEKCKEFGVSKSFDSQIQELRRVALGMTEGDVDEASSIA